MKKAWIDTVPRLAREREHVGIAEPFGMHRLAALDIGQRAQPVAIDGGKLVILLLRRIAICLRQPRLNPGRFAGEELLRLANQLGIIRLADAADAGRRAALDLVQQARPGRLAKKLSEQLLSRNSFCSALSVRVTDPALANGP